MAGVRPGGYARSSRPSHGQPSESVATWKRDGMSVAELQELEEIKGLVNRGQQLGVLTYADQFRRENGLAPDTPLPADIVTASGSGLDPDISVEAADLQVNRIVAARQALGGKNGRITAGAVLALLSAHIQGPDLGFLGEPRVNVLELNRALDALYGPPSAQK